MSVVHAGEWSGFVGVESLGFVHDELSALQHDHYFSAVVQPEFNHEWDDGQQSIHFIPWFRISQHDAERTHFDLRELNYFRAGDDWELTVGLAKVFWGVTETVHLVDIINQTDGVESTDGEDKFGQPMFLLSLIRDWGTVDLFVLPGFRERSFAGPEGRPNLGLPVDTDNPLYESGTKDHRVDAAIRWSHSIGDWDAGLAHFHGTSREPRLIPGFDAMGTPVKLIPLYEVIDQTSLDLQATKGDWLWKFEAITRTGQDGRFFAAAGGFEYTLVGVMDTAIDVGIVGEYLFDDRHQNAPTPFDNDLTIGTRITLNDAQSTELLVGFVNDLDGTASIFNIEGSRRIGQNWKATLEVRGGFFVNPPDPLNVFRRDSHFRLELARYF